MTTIQAPRATPEKASRILVWAKRHKCTIGCGELKILFLDRFWTGPQLQSLSMKLASVGSTETKARPLVLFQTRAQRLSADVRKTNQGSARATTLRVDSSFQSVSVLSSGTIWGWGNKVSLLYPPGWDFSFLSFGSGFHWTFSWLGACFWKTRPLLSVEVLLSCSGHMITSVGFTIENNKNAQQVCWLSSTAWTWSSASGSVVLSVTSQGLSGSVSRVQERIKGQMEQWFKITFHQALFCTTH